MQDAMVLAMLALFAAFAVATGFMTYERNERKGHNGRA